MSDTHDLERRMTDYYATEAPSRAPDRVLAQALATIETTSQGWTGLRRAGWVSPRPSFARLSVTAAAVAATGLIWLTLLWGPAIGPAASPSPTPAASEAPTTSGGMWPQSSLDEVRRAQELADAGDPAYTWQVSRTRWIQPAQNHPMSTEFFTRFIEEELGWEKSIWTEAFAHRYGVESGDVVYVRCRPGGNDSRYAEPRCAPTIDESRYETVKIHVAQLVREGPTGIWVVTRWETIVPSEATAPPSDAEISASLGAFLQARIDGAGAEDLADVAVGDPYVDERADPAIPLLYGTTSGTPYGRSEFELVDGPTWPEGAMQFKVRLFAESGETVVEQVLGLTRNETGGLRLVYDFGSPTTENGRAVPVEYGFLDGAVTYRAAPPLTPSTDGYRNAGRVAIEGLLPDDGGPRRVLVMVADPRPVGPACVDAPAPDAEALARSIGSDPDVEATAPVDVTIGGAPALRIDMVLRAASSSCSWKPFLLANAPGSVDRARLYLVDRPGGSGRVLALATITDEDSFETVLEWAAPVVDSIEFHAP